MPIRVYVCGAPVDRQTTGARGSIDHTRHARRPLPSRSRPVRDPGGPTRRARMSPGRNAPPDPEHDGSRLETRWSPTAAAQHGDMHTQATLYTCGLWVASIAC